MKIEEIKRVVLRGTNWVGDAAMSVPALRELRRVLPDAHITLCTRKNLAELFEDADFLDEVLIYERSKNAFQTVRYNVRVWRERQFDLAVLFPNSFESALAAKFGKTKNRIGYKTDNRGFLLTHALNVPEWKSDRHEVFYYLNIVAELEKLLHGKTEVFEHELDISLSVSEERKSKARRFLMENGVDFNRKIIALCPGSTNSRAKRWGVEKYAALADLFGASANVLLVGAPEELDVSAEVVKNAKSKPILLTGKTTLSELTAILSLADLLVTNDTGPAHIAPAVGTKTIVLFGPTIPATTRPFSDLAEIVRKPPPCAPCMLRDCPIDHRCMTAITPEEVFQVI
ncbi:MAG: lipopolysaccharide heptosyltransferase II [Acidobacteriota bacterium]|nr:lipopolysaccharide heptosyltransferase II [Acidobacteriota bacterium]